MIDIKKTYRCEEDQRQVNFVGESGPFIFGTIGVPVSHAGVTAVIWMKDDGRVCCSSGNSLCMGLIEIKPAAIDKMIEWLNARTIKQYGASVYQQALSPNVEADVYRAALTEARRIKAEAEKEG